MCLSLRIIMLCLDILQKRRVFLIAHFISAPRKAMNLPKYLNLKVSIVPSLHHDVQIGMKVRRVNTLVCNNQPSLLL